MTAAHCSRRSTRPSRSLRALWAPVLGMAAFFLAGDIGAAQSAPAVPVAPTPLGGTASASPTVAPAAAAPQLLAFTTPPAGAAGSTGPAAARGEGRVAAGRPVTFLLKPNAAGLYSIGVSSPQNAARLSIYLGDSPEVATGTAEADGAIRWSTELAAGETVKIVVHTAGPEIPFRVEATAGAGGV